MNVTVFVEKNGVIIPKRANETDAGYDILATKPPRIVGELVPRMDGVHAYKSIDYIEYSTNLKIAPQTAVIGKKPHNFHTLIHPRSSISKYNLVLANSVGLIDQGYRNEVLLRFKYVAQPEDLDVVQVYGGFAVYLRVNQEKIYKEGDKIGQLVFEPTVSAHFVEVEGLDTTDRNTGGFGSTGR